MQTYPLLSGGVLNTEIFAITFAPPKRPIMTTQARLSARSLGIEHLWIEYQSPRATSEMRQRRIQQRLELDAHRISVVALLYLLYAQTVKRFSYTRMRNTCVRNTSCSAQILHHTKCDLLSQCLCSNPRYHEVFTDISCCVRLCVPQHRPCSSTTHARCIKHALQLHSKRAFESWHQLLPISCTRRESLQSRLWSGHQPYPR